MKITAILLQLLELATALALAPLLVGWVNQCRAWLRQLCAAPWPDGASSRRPQSGYDRL